MTPDRSLMRTKGRVIVTRMGQDPQVLLAASAGLGRKTVYCLKIERGRVNTWLPQNPKREVLYLTNYLSKSKVRFEQTLFLYFLPD